MKNFTTPKGIAGYSNLIRPDTKFDEGGVYKTSITVSAEAAEALIELIQEEAQDELGKKTKLPNMHWPFKTNEETDEVTFSFKSKATDAKGNKRPAPKLFDGKGNPIRDTEDLNVGGGSLLKIKGAASAYTSGKNIGVTLYLNSVQIIKLVEFNAGGFDEDDEAEYVAANDKPKRPSDSSGAEEHQDEQEEEDIPF